MGTNKQAKEAPQIEVTDRELGTLVELDPATLDPKFQYRWVHKTPLKVSRHKAKGYVLVDPAEEEDIKNVVGDSPEAEDGTYTIGDVVLMKIDKTHYKARRHAVKRKADQRLKGPSKKFKRDTKAAAARRGVDIEVITDKEPKEE